MATFVEHTHILLHNIHRHIEFGSESFEEFLDVLGEKIRLKGWERFRGGLDVKGSYEVWFIFDFFVWQKPVLLEMCFNQLYIVHFLCL